MPPHYKRNQVEEAIFRTLRARHERVEELRFRLKRLLVTDRRLGTNAKLDEEENRHYAFYSQKPPGSGTEIMFSAYEAFAQLAAIMILEHGLPQAGVVKLMRQVRRKFEIAHAQTLKKDPTMLFDQKAIVAKAKAGDIALSNTEPVFLIFTGLRDSSVDTRPSAAAVCHGEGELDEFIGKHRGKGATFFEFVGPMRILAVNLSHTRPIKRGRGAS